MTEDSKKQLQILCIRRYNAAIKFLDESKNEPPIVGRKPITEEAEVPGFEKKQPKFGEFIEKEFVVMMTDIRKSTDIIRGPDGIRSMFIIYYVYSAIVAKIVDDYNGTSTEFLGDGVLSLFQTDSGLNKAMLDSMTSSQEIILARNEIMNPFFLSNNLPAIDFGIGIDHGVTIVTRFGHNQDNDLKAFGKCVYDVSRLSKSMNEILVSTNSKQNWPYHPEGKLRFFPKYVDGNTQAF